LASFLAVLEWRWLLTGDTAYKDMFLFWSKIFAVGFGMGVVSGVVMAYEFGTNWSGFSTIAGNITGPLLTYEVLTAFFLEAGFLGVMLFGWQRVSPRAHFFATLMVAVGTLISTFWILASNSFMQTPQGFAIENGRIVPVDWMKVIFNPSFPYRLAWETEHGGTALNLVGLPDMNAEVTRYTIQIPHLGSLILTHSWDGEIRGLKEFPPGDRPYSPIVFWTFRIMAGLGMLMLLTALLGLLLRVRGRLYETRWYQRFVLCMGPSGIVALLAGWITTEVGRQPWTVYGVLRTADSLSPISAQQAGVSLLIFVLVYFLVFGMGVYYMLKMMKRGPEEHIDGRKAGKHPILLNRALEALEGE
jgi:cytochrome bd-type quinol oxidase subunit 1